MLGRGVKDPLDEIERGAIDPRSDLVTLLRKCIVLGGRTGSAELREWASLELNGYNEIEVPDYRKYAAPLLLDGFAGNAHIRGQVVSAELVPDDVRSDALNADREFREPISQLIDMRKSAGGPDALKLAPPGMSYLVALMNSELARHGQVERAYWTVSPLVVGRTIEAVRTNLVGLVAEMRAGRSAGQALPSSEVVDQAVQVVVKGLGNRVNYVSVGSARDVTTTTGGTTTIGGEGQSETRGQRIWWWVFGGAGLVGAAATVVALL